MTTTVVVSRLVSLAVNHYVYTTTLKTVVNKSEVQYIYDEPGKKMITLVTCASGEDGEVDRTSKRSARLTFSVIE